MTAHDETSGAVNCFDCAVGGKGFLAPWPPVLGICSRSGSGKTLLIERLVPRLRRRGARVAVVKHCAHRIEADAPGKDSDRIFRAGADVLAAGRDEAFARFHEPDMPLRQAFRRVAAGCDVCLVEGYRGQDIPRIRVASAEAEAERAGETNVLLTVTDALAQVEAVEAVVWDILERSNRALPAMGLVLPAAGSESGEETAGIAIKQAADALRAHVQRVFLSGEPPALSHLDGINYLLPAPHAKEPLAGILGAMRWHPAARWVVVAGSFSLLKPDFVARLLSHVRVGVDAVLPRLDKETDAPADPPFAVYEPACLPPFEIAALEGVRSAAEALPQARILRPVVPLS